MRIRTLLATTAVVYVVGLTLVALPRRSASDADPPKPTAETTDPATTPMGTPATAPLHEAVPPIPVETQHQQLNPDELEGPASTVPVVGHDEDYHGTVAIESELIIPCNNGSQPADLEDPQCVARWSAFHVAAGLVGHLDARWIEPTLLDELSSSSSGAEAEPSSELLVLDSIGRPNQVAPGRAEIEVVVERAWPTGELEHLFYRVTLVRSSQNTWSVVAIGRS